MSENKMMSGIMPNGLPDQLEPIQVVPQQKKRGRPAKIQKQMFVEMWNGSTNLNEVAETLGISKLSCSVRASNLRKEGVNLNRFKRGRKALKK